MRWGFVIKKNEINQQLNVINGLNLNYLADSLCEISSLKIIDQQQIDYQVSYWSFSNNWTTHGFCMEKSLKCV